jgi:hypothetical protein
MQKLKSQEQAGTCKGATLTDFIALFESTSQGKGHSTLPKNAAWFVMLPSSWVLQVWDWAILALSLYFFWEVPVNWAFRTSVRLGMPFHEPMGPCDD